MNKKIVSFVNTNYQQGATHLNAFYLPYTSGVLWSYAIQFGYITDNYELGEFIWRRDSIDDVVTRIKDHHIICLSGYVWNRKYQDHLARKLKEANPNLIFIAGGPEYPIEKSNIFETFPYVDICVKQEGERTFSRILSELSKDNPDLLSIPGILINNNGSVTNTGDPVRIDDIDEIPSPYLTGIFDDLMKKHPEITWNVIYESNRGCPYQCTFCDWGSLTYTKVKRFDMGRALDEIEWFGKNKIDYVSIADANFGMFYERDMAIAEKFIATKKKYDYPKAYTMTWAKNQKLAVLEIATKLAECGNRAGMQISLQSLSIPVLTAIKRKNLGTNQIEETLRMCEERNIGTYVELILGLPEETLDSWKNNYYNLFETGVHSTIYSYQAMMLENAEMNLTQREKYDIKTLKVYGNFTGAFSPATDEDTFDPLDEDTEVVVATNTMPWEDMVSSMIFNWYIYTFHMQGTTTWISRFLRKYSNISYKEFYDGLYLHMEKDPWFHSEIERIKRNKESWTTSGKIPFEVIAETPVQWWTLVHTTLMRMQEENKHKHMYDLIESYVRTTFDLPEDICQELMLLQRTSLVDYHDLANWPKVLENKYDIIDYIRNDSELNNPSTYRMDFIKGFGVIDSVMNPKDLTLNDFCLNYYYGRKQQFGRARITKI
jgi:tRNA A37 methylthiotransferase MiaB